MEKEISFQINREEEYFEVTSDLDDNIDIIDIDEIMALIAELLNCSTEKIKNNIIAKTVENNVLDEMSEEKMVEAQKQVDEEIAIFVGNLIYSILNFIHNKDLLLSGQKPKDLDYSLAVYMDLDNSKNREVYETFHYNKVKGNEKLLGGVAFFKDSVNELLKSNKSKEEVKQIFNKSMKVILYNLYDYIDKYKVIKE